MFKRKSANLKHSLREQHSLSSLHPKITFVAVRTLSRLPKSNRSKDSKSSLNNKKTIPPLKINNKPKKEMFGRRSEEIKPSRLKTKEGFASEYMNIEGKKRQTKTPMRTRGTGGFRTFREHSEYRDYNQPQPAIQPFQLAMDDLMCDQVLDHKQPFPLPSLPSLSKTPTHQKPFDRYGLDLSVVQQRIISEEQKEFISDKKKKTHTRMPTASTADREKTQSQLQQRSVSPFQGNRLRKPAKISINVHSLIKKSKCMMR